MPTAEPTAVPTVEPAQAEGPQIITPKGYVMGAGLPIYAAARGNYHTQVEPGLFTDAAKTDDETHYNGLVDVRTAVFADGGYFSASEDNYSFSRYKDTKTWHSSLRGEINRLIWFAKHGGGQYVQIEPQVLQKDALHGITLADAQAAFEEVLQKTAAGAWVAEDALDMDVDRIHQIGEAYNADQRGWDDLLGHNYYYPDYAALTENDECYYLEYGYLVNGLPAYYEYDWFGAETLMGEDGIEEIDVHVKYLPGEELPMPDKLVTAEEAMAILPQEMRKYPMGGKLHSIISLEMVYSVQEVKNSPTGRAFVPAWYITYLDTGAAKQGYDCTAVISALDGFLIQSMFDDKSP